MRFGVAFLITAILLAAGCGGGSRNVVPYEPRTGDVFLDVRTGDLVSSAELMVQGKRAKAEGRRHVAFALFRLVARFGQDTKQVREAMLEQAFLFRENREWKKAFDILLRLGRRAPDSEAGRRAQRELFETAKAAAVQDSADEGADMMQTALEAFPQKEFAPGYAIWLARFLHEEEEDTSTSTKVCRFIVEEYSQIPEVVSEAIYLLGELALTRYNGIAYDAQPLRDADKHYLQVLQEYPSSTVAVKARKRRAQIDEILARKELIAGEFYRARGLDTAAAIYYRSIVKNHPTTEAAREAQERLRELGPDREPPARQPGEDEEKGR